jgi:hypothetical protein
LTKGQNYCSSSVQWPKCREWDIFEITNRLSNKNQGTSPNGTFSSQVTYPGGQYHTWVFKVNRHSSDWTQQKLL